MYDRACEMWQLVYRVLCVVMGGPSRHQVWRMYWSSHQRFFKQMLMASKVSCLSLTCSAHACIAGAPTNVASSSAMLIACKGSRHIASCNAAVQLCYTPHCAPLQLPPAFPQALLPADPCTLGACNWNSPA